MIAKRTLLTIHKWCGLAACLFIAVQALTGSLLLFRQELAELLDPAGMVRHTVAGEAPPSRVLAAVRARYPDFVVQRIVWPQDPRATYFAHLVDSHGNIRFASVDPGDARVLRAGSIWSFPMEAVLAIHFRLMTGRVGLAVVLLTGLAILGMAISGLAYWWPRAGRWKTSMKIGWRLPLKALLRQLHRTTGVVVALLVGGSAITGLLVGGEYMLDPGRLTSVTPSATGQGSLVGVDEALARARTLYPGRALRDVRLPSAGKFNVFFWAPAQSALAVDGVKTDLASGEVVALAPATADRSIWMPVLPIHSGEQFGLAGRLVLLVSALGLLGLAVTGPIMWLQRRK